MIRRRAIALRRSSRSLSPEPASASRTDSHSHRRSTKKPRHYDETAAPRLDQEGSRSPIGEMISNELNTRTSNSNTEETTSIPVKDDSSRDAEMADENPANYKHLA